MIRSILQLVPLLALGGCPRPVPDHLKMEPNATTHVPASQVVDTRTALAAMLKSDPLARSPELLEPDVLAPLEGAEALAAYVDVVRSVERGEGILERSMQQIEEEWSDTVVVPLSRGYRLRIAENLLASSNRDPQATQTAALALLTPLEAPPGSEEQPRTPLEWLGGPQVSASIIRNYADRWVLQGWLVDPSLPVDVLAPLLAAPQYDGLRETPMGTLVLARAQGRSGDEVGDGFDDLVRATELSLERVAADRDKEQAAWADLREAESTRLGVEDPVSALLHRAGTRLTAGAGDDRAAGGALLALTAHRWIGTCGHRPCVGVDRVETIRSAARWHSDVGRLAAVWEVIALKEALDTLEIGHDTVLFPKAAVGIVDALLGTGGGPFDGKILQQRRPDPSVWLSMARAVGQEGVVDWEGAREAIGTHLQRETQQAIAFTHPPRVQALLERIERRAIP